MACYNLVDISGSVLYTNSNIIYVLHEYMSYFANNVTNLHMVKIVTKCLSHTKKYPIELIRYTLTDLNNITVTDSYGTSVVDINLFVHNHPIIVFLRKNLSSKQPVPPNKFIAPMVNNTKKCIIRSVYNKFGKDCTDGKYIKDSEDSKYIKDSEDDDNLDNLTPDEIKKQILQLEQEKKREADEYARLKEQHDKEVNAKCIADENKMKDRIQLDKINQKKKELDATISTYKLIKNNHALKYTSDNGENNNEELYDTINKLPFGERFIALQYLVDNKLLDSDNSTIIYTVITDALTRGFDNMADENIPKYQICYDNAVPVPNTSDINIVSNISDEKSNIIIPKYYNTTDKFIRDKYLSLPINILNSISKYVKDNANKHNIGLGKMSDYNDIFN